MSFPSRQTEFETSPPSSIPLDEVEVFAWTAVQTSYDLGHAASSLTGAWIDHTAVSEAVPAPVPGPGTSSFWLPYAYPIPGTPTVGSASDRSNPGWDQSVAVTAQTDANGVPGASAVVTWGADGPWPAQGTSLVVIYESNGPLPGAVLGPGSVPGIDAVDLSACPLSDVLGDRLVVTYESPDRPTLHTT